MGVRSVSLIISLPFSLREMSLSPATTDPVFIPDKAYLAPGVASTCRASPRLPCKLDIAEGYVDAIELSPVTPVDKQSDDLERLSVLSAKRRTQKTREKIQYVTLCWFVYLEGWNDGSNGPLLPRIQKVYGVHFLYFVPRLPADTFLQVGYAVVSLIFVFACVVSLCMRF
jgi:hypothetical protein